MKRLLLLLVIFTSPLFLFSQNEVEQQDTSWKTIFRETSKKINDLVHTKLDVKFDFEKAWMYGKEWLTLKPHFYSTDSLTLDAKGIEIKYLALISGTSKLPLKYENDGQQLKIKLGRIFNGGENYTIYIDYISKPNDYKSKGSAAITEAKGLYFINPTGKEKNKPTQIWTQGETEANSVWMPTIDKPNQKTTEEIYMTVPAKYVTLSNGLLKSQKANSDGTRTDYWKMDLPHAPYLFFMGVGEFSIIKDSYKGKEVSYYVEKDYASVARRIFGHTPEMIQFFSNKLGVEYPWQKYAQIVGRDYVSGAMENTTATLHQESAYQNARELTDGIGWESTIAHELFHQWFGDLVTAESWSNITVNESFANYSETLWDEYKNGKDAGDAQNYLDMQGYLQSPSNPSKNLVRFHYADKEDVFDGVSYNKGGRILHMLRNYVGDDAFFKSLNNYLSTNKFKAGEAGQLRLAFEEVTGMDMNWYWNQWYYGSGHPIVEIDYNYDDVAKKATVVIKQTQKTGKIFRFPIAIDIYNGSKKIRRNVWVENKTENFSFGYVTKPDLINVDADKIMLWVKTDNKTAENYEHQIKHAPNYLDRKEAIDYFAKNNLPELSLGLTDKFAPLRRSAIAQLAASKLSEDAKVNKAIESIANAEKDKKTKAEAIMFLAKTSNASYKPLYEKNVNDSSYTVAGAALKGLLELEPSKAYTLAKKYSTDAKGVLSDVVSAIIMGAVNETDFDYIATNYENAPPSQEKVGMSAEFGAYLEKVQDVDKIKQGITSIMKFRNIIPEEYRQYTDPTFKTALDKLSKLKGKEIEDFIKGLWNNK